MFCGKCGAENSGEARFCAKCGVPSQPPVAPAATPAADPPAIPGATVSSIPQMPPGFVAPPTTSAKAVASLILGFLFFAFPAAIAAIVLGHLALLDIRKSAGRLTGQGIAIGGLVLGYLGIVMIPLVLIIAAIAIPNILRSRMAADQISAVDSLREINSAATTYSNTYHDGYPQDLDALAGLGTQSCDHAGLIDGELAAGIRNGYIFRYEPAAGDANLQAPATPAPGCSVAGARGYTLTADPVTRGTTGQRSFYTDATGVTRYETNGPATADSEPVE
jgi:type IV pilus assembly protein PilA